MADFGPPAAAPAAHIAAAPSAHIAAKGKDPRVEQGYTPSYPVDPAWYMDTGATDHMTKELNKLSTYQPYYGHDQVHTANGVGIGRGARLELLPDGPATSPVVHVDRPVHAPPPALDPAPGAPSPTAPGPEPMLATATGPEQSPSPPPRPDSPPSSPSPSARASLVPTSPESAAAHTPPGPTSPGPPSPGPTSPGPSSPESPGPASPAPDIPSDPVFAPPRRPHTRNRSGIVRPKERTDDTVTYLAACLLMLWMIQPPNHAVIKPL
nr:lysine-rich arabinogalactan protein 19-like [Aegilops tauschii subsp. strangulata]